jgi:hypothetical protein
MTSDIDIVDRLRARISSPADTMTVSTVTVRLRGIGRDLNDAADEIERLRAAIDSLLHDIDIDHTPDPTVNGRMCRTCGAGDGSWPCVHRMALDELKEARRDQ